MKKPVFNCKTLLLALSLCAAAPSLAQTSLESTSTTIYDFSKFNDLELLQFFADLDAQGRKYPTIDELKSKGLYDEIPSTMPIVLLVTPMQNVNCFSTCLRERAN